jgi:hypothetical protein
LGSNVSGSSSSIENGILGAILADIKQKVQNQELGNFKPDLPILGFRKEFL